MCRGGDEVSVGAGNLEVHGAAGVIDPSGVHRRSAQGRHHVVLECAHHGSLHQTAPGRTMHPDRRVTALAQDLVCLRGTGDFSLGYVKAKWHIGGPCAVLPTFERPGSNEFVAVRARVRHGRSVVVDFPGPGDSPAHFCHAAGDVPQGWTRYLPLTVGRNAIPGAIVLAVKSAWTDPLEAGWTVVVNDLGQMSRCHGGQHAVRMRRWCAAVSNLAVCSRESRKAPALARVLVAVGTVLAEAVRGAPPSELAHGTGLATPESFGAGLAVGVVGTDLVVSLVVARPAPELEPSHVAAPGHPDIERPPVGATLAVV